MPMPRSPYLTAGLLFALIAPVIVLTWSWLGSPVAMPPAPLAAGDKLDCVSYTPYQAADSPFTEGNWTIAPERIEADVARLMPFTSCLRTYSAAGHGIAEVPRAAGRKGMTVMQGIWISRDPVANAAEVQAAVSIGKSNPGTVTALIVGNEVLLRQEQTPAALIGLIKEVKAQTSIPVTYADVWEFWIKNPSVAEAVDFMTIHILPFWEDEPVSAEASALHVINVYEKMTAAFPGKRIIIGEVGWPSAGRMREVARPSPANQARVLHDVIAATRAKGITANIIEAIDQPWKRRLEGTVGGHWGVFDAESRLPKFVFGEPVSNHPSWRWQAAIGGILAAITLGLSAFFAGRRKAGTAPLSARDWTGIGIITATGSVLAGLSIETLAAGAFGSAGTARAAMLGTLALMAPLTAAAIAAGAALPGLAQLIGPKHLRVRCPLTFGLGAFLILSVVTAIQIGLSVAFQPRYWEFPFAPMSAAAVAIAVLSLQTAQPGKFPGLWTRVPEKVAALILLACSVVIVGNEGFENWQALWLCAAFTALAVGLWLIRGAPVPER